MPTNHGSIEFLKFPDPQHPGDTTRMIKKWLRDSWARRKILALQQAIAGIVVPSASTANPQMDGTAAPGVSTDYARADHVHPHDTSKADKATTLAGYGITNAYTKSQVDGMIPTVPTNVSAFTNDAGYLTSAPVTSVNSQTGAVSLNASDVGALPSSTVIPSNTSDLTNDSGFITSSKFAVVDGTCASDGNFGTNYAYPTGFTFDNSVVLSLSILYTSNWYYAGDGVLSTSGRLVARLSTGGIAVRQSQAIGYGVPFRVVLMRTDI